MTKSAYARRGEANNALWAHIPLPKGAQTSCYWSPMPDDPEGRWWRDLQWCEFNSAEASVGVAGDQYSDGRVDREIYVIFDNDARGSITTSAAARELAAHLLETADRLDAIEREVQR